MALRAANRALMLCCRAAALALAVSPPAPVPPVPAVPMVDPLDVVDVVVVDGSGASPHLFLFRLSFVSTMAMNSNLSYFIACL